ncbi:uncharacterized protein LOC143302627 isoform X2 [Bombus vancouverensis nearcticus]|uniref:uncharacterized protein LOC143302627 isoform X2 n=1 Tax=Bombus vancouverensis nearcticus TaxID=2705178 RepID=UPI00402B9F64
MDLNGSTKYTTFKSYWWQKDACDINNHYNSASISEILVFHTSVVLLINWWTISAKHSCTNTRHYIKYENEIIKYGCESFCLLERWHKYDCDANHHYNYASISGILVFDAGDVLLINWWTISVKHSCTNTRHYMKYEIEILKYGCESFCLLESVFRYNCATMLCI